MNLTGIELCFVLKNDDCRIVRLESRARGRVRTFQLRCWFGGKATDRKKYNKDDFTIKVEVGNNLFIDN
jgi:hypothetical protein